MSTAGPREKSHRGVSGRAAFGARDPARQEGGAAMEHSTYRRGGPVIGIGAHAGPARWAIWEKPVALLPLDLLGRVTAAGCVPVVLPPVPGVEQAVDRLDGLLLPGGLDVDPARYGAAPHSRGRPVDPNRDAAEFALLE